MFTHRPRRIRVVCAIGAASVLILFTLVGTLLSGSVFQRSDQIAMIVLGFLFAGGIMLIAKPRVEADEAGIRVKNIVTAYALPWEAVRAVSFDRGRPWLTLELENDDAVSVLAVQAVDKEHAVHAVRSLRSLHMQARSGV